MEISFPLDDKNAKEKYHKGSDVFGVVDSYFQLGFRIVQVWYLIYDIFTLWKNISIKNLRAKKDKPLICGISKIGLEIKNLPDDMTITPWRTIQGVKDEKPIIAILSCVSSGELSIEEMCDEFKK
jgi:hypothetical protein